MGSGGEFEILMKSHKGHHLSLVSARSVIRIFVSSKLVYLCENPAATEYQVTMIGCGWLRLNMVGKVLLSVLGLDT